MRKIKSLMLVALTLIMGLSRTSCLDSGETSSISYAYLRVKGMMGVNWFEDALGNRLYPTTASLTQVESSMDFKMSETNLAYIAFEFIEDEEGEGTQSLSESTSPQSYTIDLKAAQSLDGPEVVISQTLADMEYDAPENAPVNTLSLSSGYGTDDIVPYLYDLETLILPIQFNLTNAQEEFEMHRLVLACSLEEMQEGATDLVFYLRHNRGEDEGREVYYSQWYAYDIRYAVEEFQIATGAQPKQIIVKAHEDINQTGEIPADYTEYEIEYKMPTLN